MSGQFYGVKYPFSDESYKMTFFDMNETKEDSIKSMLLHIILTPKGQRLRHPNFGTDLIKYIFEPNNSNTWENIKEEISKQVSFYLPEVTFDTINIAKKDDENDNSIYVEIVYHVEHNGISTKNNVIVKI